ncbi:hypothetical protein KY386_01055 [Candidatus Parcubacteria bacterium]|nr:hypothetical protein [Candidatus Parcubacteria bacterium]
MLALAFFRWWYGAGWRRLAARTESALAGTYHYFSVPLLVPTLFAPWKRIVAYPGKTLGEKLRALVDNLVSRAVGLVVRLLVLMAAAVCLALLAVIGLAALAAWPFLPLLAVLLPLLGVVQT